MRLCISAFFITLSLTAALFACSPSFDFNNPNDPESADYLFISADRLTILPEEREQLGSVKVSISIPEEADEATTVQYAVSDVATSAATAIPEDAWQPFDPASPPCFAASRRVSVRLVRGGEVVSEVASAKFTIHPLLYSWEFDTSTESWVCDSVKSISPVEWNEAGYLSASFNSNANPRSDPKLYSGKLEVGKGVAVPGIAFIELRLRNRSSGTKCQFYAHNADDADQKRIDVAASIVELSFSSGETESGADSWIRLRADLRQNTIWSSIRLLRELRFDPADKASDWIPDLGEGFDLDYIRLFAEGA